ncbi:MAG: cobalamin biosynthesis protein CobD [Lachnospiraceae bacterium]|nr:cobalamin biosynthesis protein CobD [Lachnospiraceae bacterium]
MSGRLGLAYHILAFTAGFLIDQVIGDPKSLPHPVCLIGKWIGVLQNALLDKKADDKVKYRRGIWLVVWVILGTVTVAAALLVGAYLLHPLCGLAVESIMTWQILAVKSLKTESMLVYEALQQEGLPAARKAVAMIVGRDTDQLDEAGVIRAAVETVAENTSDGVIAPMLYLAVGGPMFGFLYKAINTMDSMIGYKNDTYLYFGRAAAKLDDAANYVPARISAGLMLLSCIPGRVFDHRNAWLIYRRDRRKHASPNAAQTESVCAGALHIRLAGPTSYFGKIVKKPYIGDVGRKIRSKDIVRANRLMYRTAWLGEALCLGVLGGILWMI